MAEQKSNDKATGPDTPALFSMQSVQNVLGGAVDTANRFIERSPVQPGSDNEDRIVHLSAMDRKWITQLSLCLLSVLSVPLFLVLLLIAGSSGSTTGFIISLFVLACCCCLSCGNVYWLKKDLRGYQRIE